MKAVYTTIAAPTLAATIADIAALLCGADIADLSANCAKASSQVDRTIPAGWTLVDAAASATDRVISAPDVDGLTQKYLRLGGTATYLSVMGYESWNAAAHTGVNPTNGGTALGAATNAVKFATTAVQQYYVLATPRYAIIIDMSAPSFYIGCFEFTRMAPWLKGTTYPSFAVTTSSGSGLMSGGVNSLCSPRLKAQAAAGDLIGLAPNNANPGSLSTASLRPRYTSVSVAISPTTPALDAQDQPFHSLMPIWAGLRIDGGSSLPLGAFMDIAETTNTGANADTLVDASGGKWHILLAGSGASGAMALRYA